MSQLARPQSSASLRFSLGSCVAAKLLPRRDALAVLAGTNVRLAAEALALSERRTAARRRRLLEASLRVATATIRTRPLRT